MRKLFTIATALAVALTPTKAVLAENSTPLNKSSGNVLTLAVFGDSPYGTSPTDTAQFDASPTFIDSINVDPDVDLVLHVGDIHSGKQYCTQEYDQSIYNLFTKFSDPLVYTPGDNETTDCHKFAEGGGAYNSSTRQIDYRLDASGKPIDYAQGDPVANLELIRSIFFAQPNRTLGTRKQLVLSQSLAYDRSHPSDHKFVENVMWFQGGVLFVTINLPGGSNNDTDIWYGAPKDKETDAQKKAREERTGADIRWLDAAFRLAKLSQAKGVVIGAQADMWDPEKAVSGGATHQEAFEPIVQNIALNTTSFNKPVLMFNGDSHVYRSDNPLSPTASCTWEEATPCTSVAYIHPNYNVPNFHRVVVHGSTFPLEWLKLTIDPRANNAPSENSFGPFSWERVQP